jgi:hypothetical protein
MDIHQIDSRALQRQIKRVRPALLLLRERVLRHRRHGEALAANAKGAKVATLRGRRDSRRVLGLGQGLAQRHGHGRVLGLEEVVEREVADGEIRDAKVLDHVDAVVELHVLGRDAVRLAEEAEPFRVVGSCLVPGIILEELSVNLTMNYEKIFRLTSS